MCENYFTKKEVEAILKVSRYTIDDLIANKKLGHFKINERVRVSEEQIDRFLAANRVDCESSKNQMTAN